MLATDFGDATGPRAISLVLPGDMGKDAGMIVRVSEARVRPDRLDEFMSALHQLVAGFPARFDGLIGHEVLVDDADPTTVQYVTRWRDEAALVGYAGPGWRTDAVTFPGERDLLLEPLALRHLVVTEA